MAEDVKLSISDTQILDICCKIEETCADLYRYFSKIYADAPQISALWEKTAKEEDSHAEHFRLASRLQGYGIQTLKTDRNKATTILTKIQSIYENVQKSPPTLKDALLFAIKLELNISEYHMDTLAAFEDKNLERLFTSMMKNDKEHVPMLEKVYKELFE
jgi:rubrerythrin